MNSAWSEEFIREATSQFEKNMRELLAQTPGPPSGPSAGPSASRVDAGGDTLHKVIEAAASAALSGTDSSATPDGIAASLNEAIKNIKQHTSAAEGQMPFSDDELSKLMESMGIGMAMGEGDVDDAALNSFLPEMTKMMQKLLSKEILDPVLTELVDRYPDWLADNREKITSAKYEKYNQQYEYMKRICQEYAQEKETDSVDMKAKRFDRISDLMLKVQYIGPPPSELVGEMDAAGLAALDPSATPCTIM
jgi:peroxin-19